MIRRSITCFLSLTVVLSACNITKYVPEGDYLYTGGKVKIENNKELKSSNKKVLESDLSSLLRPRPNSSILGLRPKLWIYNISHNATGIPLRWLKKMGEPPVLFSSVKVDYNIDLVTNRLENQGFFLATATSDTTLKKKKASLTYLATTGPQYMIDSVKFEADSSDLGKAIVATSPQTLLRKDQPYNLDIIKTERERIDARLKEQGFYYFSPEDLLVQVDSTNGKAHKVNLYMTIKPATSPKAAAQYRINDIYIYPNFRPVDTLKGRTANTIKHKDFYITDRKKTFKPQIFERTMFFAKDDLYNRTDHNLSLQRLSSLGTFKFVKNRFVEVDTAESRLDTYYYLTPYPKKSLRAEITGKTNSANFTGSELTVSWRNRNTFKGAELLTVSAYVGSDVQISGNNSGNNILRYGAEANLNIPRFITPFKLNSTGAYIPHTKITLGYDFLKRQDSYTLRSARTSFGYVWKEDQYKEHQLNIIAVNYVQPSNVQPAYQRLADSIPSYQNAINKQFTIGPSYNFNFTNTQDTYRQNTFYLNGNFDFSGNIIGLFQKGDDSSKKKIFGQEYSQYVRAEIDFRYYRKLGLNAQWANRVLLGYSHSYGNSRSLPYVKQFFIGGTNSLRAFRARALGPGTYRDAELDLDNDNYLAADQSGDLKLEMNTEYRRKLFSVVNGAVFVDAGNIWLQRNDQALNGNTETVRQGAKFSSNFLKEMAVGTGAGIRIDASILILRLDVAFPIRKPWLAEGDRWVFDEIDFGSKSWRRENLVYNLAIGYPF